MRTRASVVLQPALRSAAAVVRKASPASLRGLAPLGLAALAWTCGGGEGAPTGPDREPRTIDVEVVSFSFRPDSVEARVGDTIRWTQRDEVAHTATSTDPAPAEPGGFDEPLDAPGDVAEVRLTRAGTIRYFCKPHPGMVGTIVVAP